MAKRFGGEFSPKSHAKQSSGPQSSAQHPSVAPRVARIKRARVGGRSNALFLLALPFAVAAFRSDPLGLALNISAMGLLLLAAWLTREGLKAEEAYESRTVARKPAIPRKILASAATGLGLFAGGLADGSLFAGLLYAVMGAGLHSLAFGLDPLRDKGADAMGLYQSDRVSKAIDRAESHLAGMKAALTRTQDRELVDIYAGFEATAQNMFRTIAEDPRDLAGLRKYLGVYLEGASNASSKYASLIEKGPAPEKRNELIALLHDLNVSFEAQTTRALSNDQTDLTVEIEVLRQRLGHGGVEIADESAEPSTTQS